MLLNVYKKYGWYIIYLGLLFVILAPYHIHAQSKIDSLKNTLQNTHGQERAELLLDLAWLTRQVNLDSAIVQAKEALEIARRIDDVDLQSRSLQRLGFYFTSMERDTVALDYLLSALELNRQERDLIAEANVLHMLGRFYINQGNDVKALDYYFQALDIRQDQGLDDDAATTLSYIGDVYKFRKDINQAVYFFKKATQLAQETENLRELSMAGVKAGNNLHILGEYEEADHYFNLALDAARAIPSIHAEAGIISVMSSAYQNNKMFDKALKLNEDFLEIAKQHESKILQARSYENIAGIYSAKGNLGLAEKNFVASITLFKSIHFPVSEVVTKLMHIYSEQGSGDKAIRAGKEALKLAKESNNLKGQQALLESLITAYRDEENYIETVESQNELLALNQILFDKEKSNQIAKMEVRYKTGQKEQAIALLKNKQEKAIQLRNALLAVVGLLIIIGFLVFNRQRLKMAKDKATLENVRLKQQQLRLDLEFKNRQLTTHSLHLVQKNEIMKDLKKNISDIQKTRNGGSNKELRSLQHLIDHSFNLDSDWEEFRLYFEEVHNGFFKALKSHSPDLTTNDLRLSALVKLNLTIKETAAILNISPDSVKTARYRLRKKLNLNPDQGLGEFMIHMEEEVMI